MTETVVDELVVTAPKPFETVRRTRGRMLVAGEIVTPKSGKVTSTNDFQADTFNLEFAMSAYPDKDLAWWQDREGMEVEIELGNEDENGVVTWRPTLTGVVDNCKIDLTARTASLSGRDYVAMFDRKTFKVYPNKTASEVVEELVAAHGMQADVTATTTNIGSYYEDEYMHHSSGEGGRSQKEWDLLTFLARKEGFSVWVEGKTLFFHDISEEPEVRYIDYEEPEVIEGLSVAKSSRTISLTVDKDFNKSKDIKVVVRTKHIRRGVTHKVSAKKASGSSITAGGGSKEATVYYFKRPNMTQEQAQEFANEQFRILTRGEYILAWTTPADLTMTPRMVLNFTNPPASYLDKDFYIDEITVHFGYGGATVMDVRAKTSPPPSEVGAEGAADV